MYLSHAVCLSQTAMCFPPPRISLPSPTLRSGSQGSCNPTSPGKPAHLHSCYTGPGSLSYSLLVPQKIHTRQCPNPSILLSRPLEICLGDWLFWFCLENTSSSLASVNLSEKTESSCVMEEECVWSMVPLLRVPTS